MRMVVEIPNQGTAVAKLGWMRNNANRNNLYILVALASLCKISNGVMMLGTVSIWRND